MSETRYTPEQIEAMREAALEMYEALDAAQAHLDFCGYGDEYERDCAREKGLPDQISIALTKARGEEVT